MSYLVNANVTHTLLCAQASKFNEKLFPERSDEEESRILVKFCEGEGPDKEDVKMFGRAFLKLKRNRDQIVEDVHWAYYPSDILLYNNVIIATILVNHLQATTMVYSSYGYVLHAV